MPRQVSLVIHIRLESTDFTPSSDLCVCYGSCVSCFLRAHVRAHVHTHTHKVVGKEKEHKILRRDGEKEAPLQSPWARGAASYIYLRGDGTSKFANTNLMPSSHSPKHHPQLCARTRVSRLYQPPESSFMAPSPGPTPSCSQGQHHLNGCYLCPRPVPFRRLGN